MNHADAAIRNERMRQRRSEGATLGELMYEFHVSRSRASVICKDVPLPVRAPPELPPIRLDAETLAVIEDAKRNPAPPYKGQGSWPG